MNNKIPVHTLCVEGPGRTGSTLLPAPAVAVVIVVVLLTAAMVTCRMPLETVITTITAGGLLAVELLRCTIAALAPRSRTL
ncbi:MULTISPECIES: hypothetical protein [Streptomyces violaceusniger group]|uniref:hypothetical protein n=1 Tax=Streptomyces malaysiensis TaxID=92644 RepID=UPI000BFF2A19|nr:hypothetical protein [Streptomyces malaysiensis]ATL88731.1 hypothetical protein SMALA_8522 [Streptomyces malaysiensis]QDL68050.1 hypothetical protein DNK48_00065 [Streptomyces malaysiensis]